MFVCVFLFFKSRASTRTLFYQRHAIYLLSLRRIFFHTEFCVLRICIYFFNISNAIQHLLPNGKGKSLTGKKVRDSFMRITIFKTS